MTEVEAQVEQVSGSWWRMDFCGGVRVDGGAHLSTFDVG